MNRDEYLRRRRNGKDAGPFPMSGYEAKQYGAIITLENAAGQTLVLHRLGKTRAAVDDAYATATALDPSFLIVCVSTPQSIYTDLKGAREPGGNRHGQYGSQSVKIPEHTTCGGSRRYMLHPRLWGSADTRNHRRPR